MKWHFHAMCPGGWKMYEKAKCVEKSLVTLLTTRSAIARQKCEVWFAWRTPMYPNTTPYTTSTPRGGVEPYTIPTPMVLMYSYVPPHHPLHHPYTKGWCRVLHHPCTEGTWCTPMYPTWPPCEPKKYIKSGCIEKSIGTLSSIISVIGLQKCPKEWDA